MNQFKGYTGLTVPYGILQYTVRHGEFNLIKVLIVGKMHFGNGFNMDDIPRIADQSGLHVRTTHKHIATLVSRGWIGFDSQCNRYYNRSWLYLEKVLNLKSSMGYRVLKNQLIHFKAFAVAATYDQLIAAQQYQEWKLYRERRKKGTSYQTGHKSKGYYPVANEAYATIFNLSAATASRYRKLASESGYIELREDLIPIELPDNNQLHYVRMKDYCNEHLIYRDGSYFLQKVTHVRSKMIRKRFRLPPEKIERIKKGNC